MFQQPGSPALSHEIPLGDEDRLDALRSYGILDTPSEPAYDRLAALLRQTTGFDWAAITFVDRHRQWFKARSGFDIQEMPREVSFCSVAMQSTQPLIVRDAPNDTCFRRNLLVTGKPYLRSYFGMPIFSEEGLGLGSICVIATNQPRSLRACHMNLLAFARDWVQANLRARRLALESLSEQPSRTSPRRTLMQRRDHALRRTDDAWEGVKRAHQLCLADVTGRFG